MLKIYRDIKGLTSLRVKPHSVLIAGLILLHLQPTCNIYKKTTTKQNRDHVERHPSLDARPLSEAPPPPPPTHPLFFWNIIYITPLRNTLALFTLPSGQS